MSRVGPTSKLDQRAHLFSLRTHQILTAAGIPCTVVLDSATAYVMDRVDMVLVGSEAVVESGVSDPPISSAKADPDV
jgi:translation initiation factor eIF-2B subunit alpha